jgi:predicted CxxxxCH...CXXCH cytochrome family protein
MDDSKGGRLYNTSSNFECHSNGFDSGNVLAQ